MYSIYYNIKKAATACPLNAWEKMFTFLFMFMLIRTIIFMAFYMTVHAKKITEKNTIALKLNIIKWIEGNS